MRGRIREGFRGHGIKLWIIGVVFLVVLPVNLLSIFSTQNYMQSLRAQVENSVKSVLQLYQTQLEREMKQTEYFFYDLSSYNTDFLRVELHKNDNRYVLALHQLYQVFLLRLPWGNLTHAYYFYSPGSTYPIVAVRSDAGQSQSDYQKYLIDHSDNFDFNDWRYLQMNGKRYLCRNYHEKNDIFGVFISIDELLSDISGSIQYPIKRMELYPTDEQIQEEKRGNTIQAESHFAKDILTLQIEMEEGSVYSRLPLWQRYSLMISGASFLLIPLLIWLINKIVTNPLQEIDCALKEMEHGNKDYRVTRHFMTRELSHMGHSYNRMADQIENLKIEAYEKALEKDQIQLQNQEIQLQNQKIQIQNLQLQVNPHFLLNIFNMIYSMATMNNYNGVKRMTLFLSHYFRDLLSHDDLHSIQMELELVKRFFSVLELQYPDCFDVSYEVEDDVTDILVPTLLIHNLIENIAKYNIQVGSFVEIIIRCRMAENGDFLIEVEDDGTGIESDILERINQGRSVRKLPV